MAQQRKRNPNGAGTITQRKDGRFQCAVYVLQPDGTRARKFAYGKTWAECDVERRELLAKVDQGVPVPTRSAKLSEWLPYWLDNVIKPRRKLSTFDKYEAHVRLYLVPLLGAKRLESLGVADVRRFLVRLEKETTAATAKESHHVLRSALSSACREELITRNVAKLVEPPRTDNRELKPWSLEETSTSSPRPAKTRCTRPSSSPSPWVSGGGRSSVSGGPTSTWTPASCTSASRRNAAEASCTTTTPRAVVVAPSRCPRSASRPCAGTGCGSGGTGQGGGGVAGVRLRLHHAYRPSGRAAERLPLLHPRRPVRRPPRDPAARRPARHGDSPHGGRGRAPRRDGDPRPQPDQHHHGRVHARRAGHAAGGHEPHGPAAAEASRSSVTARVDVRSRCQRPRTMIGPGPFGWCPRQDSNLRHPL